MNKEKMGKLLRQLRLDKKLSLEKLSDIFLEEAYLNVSVNAISNWERGKAIPDIDNLTFLANYYGISIDEILNGEIKNKNNKANYYFGSPESPTLISKDVLLSLYGRSGAWVMIYLRVKELLFKHVKNKISYSEKEELNTHLINAFRYRKGMNRPAFLRSIKEIYNNRLNDDSFWWEVQKLFRFNEAIESALNYSNNDPIRFESEYINYLEDWQKDLFLCSLPYWSYKYTESASKEMLKSILNSGAKICDLFISTRIKDKKTKTRLIDKIEELFNSINKPFQFFVKYEDEKECFITIPNTPYNRLIVEEPIFVEEMRCHGFEIDETYELLKNNETMPDEVFYEICRIDGVDPINEAGERNEVQGRPSAWSVIHDKVFKDDEVQKEIDNLLIKLKNGEHYEYEAKLINGSDMRSKYEHVLKVIEDLSYAEYLNSRNIEKTEELIKGIDSLSIKEIIDEYFVEEKEDE